jgi:8-amino-7-oxononanoate synthase
MKYALYGKAFTPPLTRLNYRRVINGLPAFSNYTVSYEPSNSASNTAFAVWQRFGIAGMTCMMPNPPWDDLIDNALAGRADAGELRRRRELRVISATHVELSDRRYINFASNNYLGLTHHPHVIDAFTNATTRNGVGSGAAALISGYSDVHASAERAIATWKGTESAVMLGSGYLANLAAVQTIAALAGEKGVRFLLDKLCHASLIDAVRASGAVFRVFPHNHLAKLQRLLQEAEPNQLQVVVSESIFSMDGDAADLAGIARLKKQFPFLLLLDEAHGSGVYGPNGSGYAAELGLADIVDVTIVTLSKAVGVSGGAICASRRFCEAVVNFGRSFIYSTNVPPAVAAAVEAALGVMRDEPERQQGLRTISESVRSRISKIGLKLPPGNSPILPIILGDERTALDAADQLLKAGLLVVAIRPPTVPRGSSRLRITLSSEHRDDEIDLLLNRLEKL